MIIPLSITRVPMANGFTWYKNAWQLIQAQPLILLLATGWAIMTLMMMASLPFIGAIASSFLTPMLAFGLADICQKIRTRTPVNPLQVFSGVFGKQRNRLFSLGVFYATVALGCLLLSQFIDGGRFMQMGLGVAEPINTDPELLAQDFASNPIAFFSKHPTILALALFQIVTLIITALFTYAPMFIGWQNTNASQAITLSLISIGRNILPILLATILTLLTLFGFIAATTVIAMALPVMTYFISLFLVLLNFTFLYAISYTSYYNILSTSLNKSIQASVTAAIDASSKASESDENNL